MKSVSFCLNIFTFKYKDCLYSTLHKYTSIFYGNLSNNYVQYSIYSLKCNNNSDGHFPTSCSNKGRRRSGCECVSPGLSPSRLSMFLRRVLVLVGSSGACWMGPNVAFFPFFPNSFSTSKNTDQDLTSKQTWLIFLFIFLFFLHLNTYESREQHWPSEILDSWNMVSKAWCVSAKDGRSEGFHLQPDRKTKKIRI